MRPSATPWRSARIPSGSPSWTTSAGATRCGPRRWARWWRPAAAVTRRRCSTARPFISGKDSLNNEYLGADGQRHAIPPTLLISAIGMIEDVSQAVTMDLKEPGNLVYLVGEFEPQALGGTS